MYRYGDRQEARKDIMDIKRNDRRTLLNLRDQGRHSQKSALKSQLASQFTVENDATKRLVS